MNNLIQILSLIFLLSSGAAFAGGIYNSIPSDINPDANYIFYSHGKIVEGNIRPKHPQWGVYEFKKILESFVWDDSVYVIAEHRPKGADPKAHADKLMRWVKELLANGVKANRITLIGFSKGG